MTKIRIFQPITLGMVLILVLSSVIVRLPSPAQAHQDTAAIFPHPNQTDATEDEINELARAVHIQNLRMGGSTLWLGGDLGIRNSTPVSIPAGSKLEDWVFRAFYEDNQQVSLVDLERPVVMNIWASWCGPCRFEFPYLSNIALNEDTNYDLWFLNSGDTSESAARRFLRTQAEGVTVYYDENDQFNRDLQMRFFPTTVLMDTDGTIIAIHIGVVRPTVMRFFDALASNPRAGSFESFEVSPDDLRAQLQPIDPNEAAPMVIGQQVASEITDDSWQQNYRFEGTAGQQIAIRMTTTEEDFESYLVLIGPDGERLIEGNNGPTDPGATLDYTLPDDGTYIIVATRFLEAEGFSRGGYTLTLNEGTAPTDPTAARPLRPNIPISGRLSRDRTQDNYTFEATEGQEVTFILEHNQPEGNLNLQVRLGAGERIVPFTSTENGELRVTVTMPQTSTYSVYVSRPMSSRAEPTTYTLTIQTAVPVSELDVQAIDEAPPQSEATDQETPDEASPPTDVEQGQVPSGDNQDDGEVLTIEIVYGDSVTGELNDQSDRIEYSFEGKEGDIVTVDMAAMNLELDTLLLVYGPTESIFAANDDNGRTTDSLIPSYTLPMDGTYTIVATRFGSSEGLGGSGQFTLTLTQETAPRSPASASSDTATPGSSSASAESGLITSGTPINDNLDNSVYETRYSFEGSAGDIVTISMERVEGTIDPYLSLETSTGKQVAFNDDDYRNTSVNAIIRAVQLPLDGTYTIVATRYAGVYGTTTGSFRLQLDIKTTTSSNRSSQSSSTSNNPARVFFDSVQEIEFDLTVTAMLDRDTSPLGFVFQGEQGMIVTISLKRASGSLDAGIVLLDTEGDPIASNTEFTGIADARIEDVRLLQTGEYLIVIGLDNEQTTGTFTLVVTHR